MGLVHKNQDELAKRDIFAVFLSPFTPVFLYFLSVDINSNENMTKKIV